MLAVHSIATCKYVLGEGQRNNFYPSKEKRFGVSLP